MNDIKRYQTNGQPSEIGRFVEYKDISKIKAEGVREYDEHCFEFGMDALSPDLFADKLESKDE